MDTIKAAYLHGVVSYGIILIIFNESKSTIIVDFFLVVLGLSVIGLPIIVVATMLTNYITDRYL